MQGRCISCEYYKDFMKSYGNCHFNPPGIDGRGMSIWPKVHEGDWCSHYQQKAAYDYSNDYTEVHSEQYSSEYSKMFRDTFGIDPAEIDFRCIEKSGMFTIIAVHKPTQAIEKSEDVDKNVAKTRALEKLIQRIKGPKSVFKRTS